MSVLGVEVGAEAATSPDVSAAPTVAEAVEELTRSGRRPRAYTEPELAPGQWIAFQGRFNIHSPQEEVFGDAVFFLQSGHGSHADGRTTRLLLHGSSQNLIVGHGAPAAALGSFASSGRLFEDLAVQPQTRNQLQLVAEDMRQLELGVPMRSSEQSSEADSSTFEIVHHAEDWFTVVIRQIVRGLELRVSPHTATWMTGYARITAVCPDSSETTPRLLTATPLVVEYLEPSRTA